MSVPNQTEPALAGESLMREGRFADAVRAYEEALQAFPDDLRLITGKAYAQLSLGDPTGAIAGLDRNLAQHPGSAAITAKAELLYAMGRLDEASQLYNDAIAADSKNAELWEGKALVLARIGDYAEALRCYDAALEIDEKRADIWSGKSDVLFALGRFSEALDCFRRADGIAPFPAADWTLRGDRLYQVRQAREAVACYDHAIKMDPRHFAAWRGKGLAVALSGSVDTALNLLETARKVAVTDEQKVSVLADQGNLLARHSDRLNDAIACYDRAIEIDPKHYPAHLGKATVLENQRQYLAAADVYDLLNAIDPKNSAGWEGKGRCLGELGSLEDAVACFDKALEISPDSLWARNDKAWALLLLRRYPEAIAEYDRAIRIDPAQSVPWASKGLALMQSGDYPNALKVLDDGLHQVSEPINVLRNIGLLFAEYMIDEDKALEVTRKILSLDPSDLSKAAVAELLVRTGKYPEARELLSQIAGSESGLLPCLANYFILVSFTLEGDAARAREQFEKLAGCLLHQTPVVITEEHWVFRGLTKRIVASSPALLDRFLLLTLIDLLTGKADMTKLAFFSRGPA